jgi:formylglycine-generating enzyme required for sulfatase activity
MKAKFFRLMCVSQWRDRFHLFRITLIFVLPVSIVLIGCTSQHEKNWTEPFTGMEFVLVPAGEFMMGSPDDEIDRKPDEAQHRVRITRDFYLGKYEVTQGEWGRIMGENPSHFKDCGSRCPVERVSWYRVQGFIARLSDISRSGAFRLPTEAEWEYACRAGTATPFSTGKNLTTDQANYDGNYPYPGEPKGIYREKTMPVGRFLPNAWGLYDMHGNVWEWCEDDYCDYPSGPAVNPLGRCEAEKKVIRGGSWYFNATNARSARRYTHAPHDVGFSLGFRLVHEVDE